jgi:hypothetical protein
LNKQNFHALLPSLRKKSLLIKKEAIVAISNNKRDPRLNNVIAVIPFSVNPLVPHSDMEIYRLVSKIRYQFFKSTFWSIYRHIPHVLISYQSTDALKWIKLIPQVWRVMDLTHINGSVFQPKATLQAVSDALLYNESFASFKYIYYSECDQIIHLRRTTELLNLIDKSNGRIVLTPHRINVIHTYYLQLYVLYNNM